MRSPRRTMMTQPTETLGVSADQLRLLLRRLEAVGDTETERYRRLLAELERLEKENPDP